MSSFSQVAVKPTGETTTRESSGQLGRTPDAQNPEQLMKASVEDYERAISRSYDDVKEAKTKDERKSAIMAFIVALKLMNVTQMRSAYEAGYVESGGISNADKSRIEAITLWNNEYASGFEQDLLEALDTDKDFGAFESRAMLYPREGWRRAYMAGIFQARREQGFTGWRRVLGESVSGPCEWCLADSQITHNINEEWTDHPLGVCKQEVVWLTFFRGPQSSMPIRIPPLSGPVPIVSGR